MNLFGKTMLLIKFILSFNSCVTICVFLFGRMLLNILAIYMLILIAYFIITQKDVVLINRIGY